MGVIKEQNKWEESVYLIEENDPVHGGEEGVSNKAAKQLANRTLYLRQLLIAAGQNLKPKKLTATTKNAVGTDGHTHEIDLASLTTKGLVQLTNDTGLDSESLALTAKAGKALAQAAATAQQTAAGKWTAVDATTSQKGIVQLNNTLTSTSTTQALTAAQGKALNDRITTVQTTANGKWTAVDATTARKGIVQLNNTLTSTSTTQALTAAQGKKLNDDKVNRSGDTIKGNLVLDKTAQNEWSALYLKSKGGDYRFEGNPDDSDNRLNIVHQVGSTQKYLRMRKFDNDEFFAYESWVKNGFAPIHNPSHTGTILGNYRLVIDRNETGYTPYIYIKDSSVDFSKTVSSAKTVSDIHALVKNGTNERVLSTLRTIIQTDKNATGHYGVVGADGTTRWAWSAFGKTGNVAIGKITDDGTHKLQVAGSIHATGQTILDSPTAIVRFQNGGTNYGYVGFPASNSKNIRLCSNLWSNSYVELQESKIVAGQALYEGSNRIQHNGMRYSDVTKDTDSTFVGLSANMNGSWYARFESVADKRWKWIYANDNAYYLPRNNSGKDKTIATIEDIRAVSRANKSRNATFPLSTGNSYATTGQVITYPDGRIEQIFHLKSIRPYWFNEEKAAGATTSYQGGGWSAGGRHRTIPIALWTAMPNKITRVHAQLMRATNASISQTFYAEAGEWLVGWQLLDNESNKSSVNINATRFRGDTNEPIDLYVVVEGY